jgi:DNA-binding NarL/FixJ family response regulator
MEESRETTVVLADDQAIVREGFAALFAGAGMRVVGECSDGGAAAQMISSLQPDFAILDLYMPVMTGIDVVRRVRASGSRAKLLILSITQDENCVIEALRAGADAYILKDGPFRHVLDALSFIRDGGVYVSPLLRGAGLFTKPERAAEDPLSTLSPREMEVFSYLVSGLRAKDIADRLEISPKTVDTYRASLMRKLNVHDLVGLVKFAIERNLTTTSPPR